MDPVLLGAAALALLALGKGAPAGRSGGSGSSSSQDAEVTFGPITAPASPPKTYWCSPRATYGGLSDESKVKLATELYVGRWGFDPPPQFRDYIAKMDPCEPRHVPNSLIDQFPPFPGQRLKASELARIARDQAARRAIETKQQIDAQASCKATSSALGVVVGAAGATAAVVAGVPPPAAGGIVSAGKGLGDLVGAFC